ncbi:MAG TPA: phosphatidate cytidylyltransferase [Chitinophagaceae bacterium]|nr:phosphatidate cytidylyltransferase [Chitinophagaceae bacterium]
MAFNWKTFRTRTLTGAIFVAAMLTGLLINRWTFFGLVSIINLGCWWEYLRLVEKTYHTRIDKINKAVLIVAGYALFLLFCFPISAMDFGIYFGSIYLSATWGFYSIITVFLGAFLFQNKKLYADARWNAVFGLVYISLPLGLLVSLKMPYADTIFGTDPDPTRVIPLVLFISLWINDTMAYLAGSLIGKTKLSKISPKKTWEGTIGGIILSAIVMIFIGKSLSIDRTDSICISLVSSIAGTFGDLFESRLKRRARVKDSGKILPGHGGFLDRFDSLLFAVPFVWLYEFFFM